MADGGWGWYGVPVLLLGAVVIITLATLVLHLLFPPAKARKDRRTVLFRRAERCPLCQRVMGKAEQHGLSIKVCPQCQGVWLSQGQLDQLMR